MQPSLAMILVIILARSSISGSSFALAQLLFDYKMPCLSSDDSPEVLDAALVHWMQVMVGTLFSIVNTHPDLVHAVHQLACFVHNPGPSHIEALDHVLR